jgi:hypothetical protein
VITVVEGVTTSMSTMVESIVYIHDIQRITWLSRGKEQLAGRDDEANRHMKKKEAAKLCRPKDIASLSPVSALP